MTEAVPVLAGAEPLSGALVARALATLHGYGGLEADPLLRYRAWPRGPADGFDGGASEHELLFDPDRPELAGLGDELKSAELVFLGPRWSVALGLAGHRSAEGPSWTARLEPLEGAVDPSVLARLAERLARALGVKRS